MKEQSEIFNHDLLSLPVIINDYFVIYNHIITIYSHL